MLFKNGDKVDSMMLQTSDRQSYGLLAALLAGWLILLGLLLIYPGFLAAHTALVRTMPADGAVVAQLPREIRFWFNEPIERNFSRIAVFRAVLDPGTGAVQPGERIDQGWLPGPRAIFPSSRARAAYRPPRRPMPPI